MVQLSQRPKYLQEASLERPVLLVRQERQVLLDQLVRPVLPVRQGRPVLPVRQGRLVLPVRQGRLVELVPMLTAQLQDLVSLLLAAT